MRGAVCELTHALTYFYLFIYKNPNHTRVKDVQSHSRIVQWFLVPTAILLQQDSHQKQCVNLHTEQDEAWKIWEGDVQKLTRPYMS